MKYTYTCIGSIYYPSEHMNAKPFANADTLGADTGEYICEGVSATGTLMATAFLVVMELPHAPARVHMHLQGAVVFSWTAPFDGRAALTAYLLYYRFNMSGIALLLLSTFTLCTFICEH